MAGYESIAGRIIQFDFDNDGQFDFSTTSDSQGRFTVALNEPFEGLNTVTARVIDLDGQEGWAVSSFVYVDQTSSLPEVVSIGLANDTGSSGSDFVTSDPTISGQLNGSGGAGATVEFDYTGDGIADGSTVAGSDGSFTFTPPNLPEGSVSLQARVANGGWVPFNFVKSLAPDSPVAQAQAAALAAINGLGVGRVGSLAGTSTAANNQTNLITTTAQAATALAQQTTNTIISGAANNLANVETAAGATRGIAIDQANASLTNAGLSAATWFSFGAFAWPDAPNILNAPVISWGGPIPDVSGLSFEGPNSSTYVNGVMRLVLQGEEALTYGTRWLEIHAALANATTAANTLYATESQNAATLFQTELSNAQQDYERAAGNGSFGITSLQSLRINAQQTHSDETLAANTRFDTATANANNAYDTAVTNASATLTAAVNAAQANYTSAEATAQAARNAENVAAGQALQAEMASAQNGGNGYNPEAMQTAYSRYMSRIQAANRAYTAAEAAAGLLRDQTIADANQINTKAVAAAEDTKRKATADATKNQGTDLSAANAKLSGVNAVVNADEKDLKFRAQVVLERAKVQAKTKYDRKIADSAKTQALSIAAAQKNFDIDSAVLEANHAKRLAQIDVDTFQNPGGNDWATYQQKRLVNEKTRVDAVETAGVTLATVSANRVYGVTVAAVNAAHQATYDSIAATLEEVEAKIAAQESYHAISNPKKKEYSIHLIGDYRYARDKVLEMERDYQRNHATAVKVKSDGDAGHQATYTKEVATAESNFKTSQNHEARQIALNAASTKYFSAINATTITLNQETIRLDDTKKATGEDIELAHELANIGKGQALAELLSTELARTETNIAKASAQSLVKHAQAEGAVEIAKATAEKNGVAGIVAAKQAYQAAEITTEGNRDIANAMARSQFESGRATAYATAMSAWANGQGNTPWANYQSSLANYAKDLTVAVSNSAVALEVSILTAKMSWVTSLSSAETAHETARADAKERAATQQLGMLVSRAQQLGIAQVGLVTASGAARSTFDAASSRAQKVHDEKASNAKKELRRKIRNADLVFAIAMVAPVIPITMLFAETLWKDRRNKIATAEKDNAHTMADAHKFLVTDKAIARATYSKSLADASTAAGTNVKSANQSVATVADSIQKELGQSLTTADQAYTDALASANKARDLARAEAFKSIGVSTAEIRSQFAGLSAAADRTFYVANAAAFQVAVDSWAGTQNTPGTNYIKALAAAYADWAVPIGTLRETMATALALSEKTAAITRLNQAYGLATLKSTQQETAEKQSATAKAAAERVATDATSGLAKVAADEDTEHLFSVLSAQSTYTKTVADAERDYDITAAAAGAIYAKRIANARARKETEPEWEGYDAELEAARKVLYDPGVGTSLTSAQRTRTETVANATVTWTETVAAKDKAVVASVSARRESASVQISDARKTMVTAIAAAEKARRDAITDKVADVEKAGAAADETALIETVSARTAMAGGMIGPTVALTRAMATAEGDFHIASANASWQDAILRQTQFPGLGNSELVREAKLWKDWLTSTKPSFVDYLGNNTASDLARVKEMVVAEGNESTSSAAAGKAFEDVSTDAAATAAKAATSAQTGATAVIESLDAEHGAAAAQSKTPWYTVQANAQAEHAVAKARSERDYLIATTSAFATWQAGELTEAARTTYDEAIATANANREQANTTADTALATARSTAETNYTTAVNNAGDAAQRGLAGEARNLRSAIASAEKAESLAVISASATLDRAIAAGQLSLDTSATNIDKAKVIQLAGYDWDFFVAQAVQAVPLVQQYAAEDGTTFSSYRASKIAAESIWRQTQRVPFLATVTTSAEAQSAYNIAVANADKSYADTIATADETVATAHANAAYDLSIAQANADEQLSLRQIEIQAAARAGTPWVVTALQTVQAQATWASSVASSELAVSLKLAGAELAYRLTEIDAAHAYDIAEIPAWATSELATANAEVGYQIQSANTLPTR